MAAGVKSGYLALVSLSLGRADIVVEARVYLVLCRAAGQSGTRSPGLAPGNCSGLLGTAPRTAWPPLHPHSTLANNITYKIIACKKKFASTVL